MAEPSSDLAASGRSWTPILAPGLDVVFVGYNPSLPAWRSGHYYANPGNRFYRLLYESGLTPRLLSPAEDRTLPEHGIGATDLLPVPSARADLVPVADFRAAAPLLLAALAEVDPRVVCCNGVGVFRHLFGEAPARLGRQPDRQVGRSALFVVPSTSGLVNGRAAERLVAFQELAAFLGRSPAEPDGGVPSVLGSRRPASNPERRAVAGDGGGAGDTGTDAGPTIARAEPGGRGAASAAPAPGVGIDAEGTGERFWGRRRSRSATS